MKSSLQIGVARSVLQRRRAWICLFVAFFLLYNPFFASSYAVRGLRVAHPPSYRATVGSAELRHFTPTTGWECLDAPDVVSMDVSPALPDSVAVTAMVVPPVSSPNLKFFGSGLWFRPPPAP